MCGRCVANVSREEVMRLAGTKTFRNVELYKLKYNCTPQAYLPCIIRREGCTDAEPAYDVEAFRWGVVPSFASADSAEKDYKMNFGPTSTSNARSENLKNSPLWRRLVKKKRCAVVVNGYYEWKQDKITKSKNKTKTPYYIHSSNTTPYECLDIRLHSAKEEQKAQETKAEASFSSSCCTVSTESGSQSWATPRSNENVAAQPDITCTQSAPLPERVKHLELTADALKHSLRPEPLNENENETKKKTNGSTKNSKNVRVIVLSDSDDEKSEEKTKDKESTTASKTETAHKPRPMLLAGLYDEWTGTDGTVLRTCTILTMSSAGMESELIHDRSPVILTEESCRKWLSSGDIDSVLPFALRHSQILGQKQTAAVEVSSYVSNSKNEGADCCKPVGDYYQKKFETGIGRFLQPLPKKRKRTSYIGVE